MADSVYMAELSWPEFERRVKAGALIFLPVSATEQHGPHLPLCTDVVLPTSVSERVARAIGGLVAPPIPYGNKSQPRAGGGESFPGTTSLDLGTLVAVVRDVIRNLGLHGVRKLAVMNGHLENSAALLEAIDLAMRDLRYEGITDIVVLKVEYSEFVHKATLDRLFPDGFPGTELEHASLIETSLMLHLRPDLVDMSKVPSDGPAKFPIFDRFPFWPGVVPPSGVLNVAHGATAEKGGWLMDDYVDLLTKAMVKEFGP